MSFPDYLNIWLYCAECPWKTFPKISASLQSFLHVGLQSFLHVFFYCCCYPSHNRACLLIPFLPLNSALTSFNVGGKNVKITCTPYLLILHLKMQPNIPFLLLFKFWFTYTFKGWFLYSVSKFLTKLIRGLDMACISSLIL